MIDTGRASLPEISAAISIFPQTFTQTLSESLRESRPIVSEFVVHRFPQPTGCGCVLFFDRGLGHRLELAEGIEQHARAIHELVVERFGGDELVALQRLRMHPTP